MIRKLIVLLAIVAALWAVPASRARIVGVSEPLLEKLGPTGERVLLPMRRWSARHELDELLEAMRQDAIEGRRPPESRDFAAYATRTLEEEATDPWGKGYWMERKGRQVTLGSSGPDGRRGNADDITKSAGF